MALPTDPAAVKGQWVKIEVCDPVSVCCEEALLVTALRTVGVALHPAFPFFSTVEEIDGRSVRRWRWLLAPRSRDGLYQTAALIKQWYDPAFRAAPATSEWAVVCAALRNQGAAAAEVRQSITRAIVRRGRDAAFIPVNASPARREWLIARLEGRLPMNAPFAEPVSV